MAASARAANEPDDPPEPGLDRIRQILRSHVEILREGKELAQACRKLDGMDLQAPDGPERRAWEIYNMWTLARVVTRSALAREESRGSHYRLDFPYRDDEKFARHSVIAREGPVRFE